MSIDYFMYIRSMVTEKQTLGKFKMASAYQNAGASFQMFMRMVEHQESVSLEELFPTLLVRYEYYLWHTRGITRNSSSAYMRSLRAIYNRAVEEELCSDRHPFSRVYTGIDKTIKRAVDERVLIELMELPLQEKPHQAFSRNLFLFSFYARGMAFIDIAKLQKCNIRDGRICYQRSKTQQLLTVKLEKPMLDILQKYSYHKGPYLFPILRPEGFDPRTYGNALRLHNFHLHQLEKLLKHPVSLTSYVARHSWATQAQAEHIPTKVISESLGHAHEETTAIYLASFDHREIDRANRKVMDKIFHHRNRTV